MEHKRSNRVSQDELMQRIVAHLHAERDAGQCETPLSTNELERLLDGELDEREAHRARTHLAQCLFCLNVYSELAAASDALASRESPAVYAQAQMPSVPSGSHAPVEALREQILQFHSELQRALKLRGHRAVQRRYSDPMLLDLDRSGGEIDPKMVRHFHEAMPAKLSIVERALEERLQELRLLKDLIVRDAELRGRILEVDVSARRDLLSILARASNLLMAWIAQAVKGVTSSSRLR